MIDLTATRIYHNTLGVGSVVEQNEKRIRIAFDNDIKLFMFPEAFEKILKCEDSEIQNEILNLIADKNKKNAEKNIYIKQTQAQIKRPAVANNQKRSSVKVQPENNVAFKCNYCNGGEEVNGIGFISPCSDDMIRYNIDVAKHRWCSNDQSYCYLYRNRKISRTELERSAVEDNYCCYESCMLRRWTAEAGYSLTKENYAKPIKLNNVKFNSLAVLTTREPYSREEDRFVFGVFLIDETYEGDEEQAGYVSTTSEYKLSLTKEEGRKIRFWNYYINKNNPDNISWGTGLFRYLNNIQAASILFDIAQVKKGTVDEAFAQEFFEYFCRTHKLDTNDFPIK